MSAPLLIRLLASGAVACALAASAQVGAAADESSPPNANRWRVIVHPSNPSRSLARSAVERIYRRRTTFWEDGRALIAINLPVGDPTRDTFMRDVMRTSAGELATF